MENVTVKSVAEVATAVNPVRGASKFCFAVAELRGNIGKTAKVAKSVSGKDILLFNLAVNQHGDLTDWYSVSVWNADLINFCKATLGKGSAVYMKCRLTTGEIKKEDGTVAFTKTYLHPYFISVLDKANHKWNNSDGTTKAVASVTPTAEVPADSFLI